MKGSNTPWVPKLTNISSYEFYGDRQGYLVASTVALDVVIPKPLQHFIFWGVVRKVVSSIAFHFHEDCLIRIKRVGSSPLARAFFFHSRPADQPLELEHGFCISLLVLGLF